MTVAESEPAPFNTPILQPTGSQKNLPTILLQYKANSKTSSRWSLLPGFAPPECPVRFTNRSLHKVTNNDAPSVDSLYFLRFLVPAFGALAPVLVPLAVLGRSPPLTQQPVRRLQKSPTRRHQCSLQSRLSRSAQNRMSARDLPSMALPRSDIRNTHHANHYPSDFCHVFDTCCASDFRNTES
jgi:hypothetical protein